MTEEHQETFNQINAFISYLPDEERKKLPKKLVRYFYCKSNCSPKEALNPNLSLYEQNFTDEALLFLFYIMKIAFKPETEK